MAAPQAKAVIDSGLLKKCPTLPLATNGSVAELLNNHTQVTADYHECAARQSALVDAVTSQKAIIIAMPK